VNSAPMLSIIACSAKHSNQGGHGTSGHATDGLAYWILTICAARLQDERKGRDNQRTCEPDFGLTKVR
jgi:hypothetical protein